MKVFLLALLLLLLPSCSTVSYWFAVHFREPKNPFPPASNHKNERVQPPAGDTPETSTNLKS